MVTIPDILQKGIVKKEASIKQAKARRKPKGKQGKLLEETLKEMCAQLEAYQHTNFVLSQFGTPFNTTKERLNKMKTIFLEYLASLFQWNWWKAFSKDPVDIVHQRIKLMFHDWRISVGVKEKKRVKEITM